MSNKSNDFGRAYEFAWIHALEDVLKKVANEETIIERNSSYEANRHAWYSIGEEEKETFKESATVAIDYILEAEPNLKYSKSPLILEAQKDSIGINGDVRDIIIKKKNSKWEIGLSIKHNHDAVKHSRISHSLDYGKEWYGIPCSVMYWSSVSPIFEELKNLKLQSSKWSDIENKGGKIYKPLLQAFINETMRAADADSDVPRKIIEYLIGVKDYYKVISKDSKRITLVYTFNMHGELNNPYDGKISALTIPIVELPSRIVAFEFKPNSDNTTEMYLNNGWQLNFRIHNASTMVEPSLKFDVQFVGMPPSILTVECKWNC